MGNVANIKVQPMKVSWGASALGFTEGDLELTFVEDKVDVTAHQEGTNILSHIRTGRGFEITMPLKETNRELVNYMLGQTGQSVTASGGASAVIGFGGGRDFTQTLGQALKLNLHPVTKASADKSEDWSFWKAYPDPESIVYSGENASILSISFKIYPDSTKATEARLGVFGDSDDGSFASVT